MTEMTSAVPAEEAARDETASAAPRGLLDLAAAEAPPAPAPAGHPAERAAQAAPTEKPRKPDRLPDAFWDAEKGQVRLEELIASHHDLRTKIARGEHKPPARPEDYRLPEGIPDGLVAPDDPLWAVVREAAHQAGIPERDLHAIAKPYLAKLAEIAGTHRPPAAPDPAAMQAALQAELDKLGPGGPAMVRAVDGWLKGLVAAKVITAEGYEALREISTAEGVRALAALRERAGEKPLGIEPGTLPGLGSEAEARALLREGYRLGADTPEGREKIARGREMLERLEAAGVRLNVGPAGG